jgi:16S rRNA (adenine1518-N6/adenine1519-N6)-dimethyltransferase
MNEHRHSRGHSQNYLRQLLSERGLAPRSSLGQCFLTDLNLLDILVAAADLSRDDLVLEIGTGTGSLTQRLAAAAGAVLSVEIDPGLFDLARETVGLLPNVRLMQADILERKNSLNPDVLAAIDELTSAVHDAPLTDQHSPLVRARLKLVANLPYVVATPVISLLLLDGRPWDRIVVTIQKELADRLLAAPGTKDYGHLSVLIQSLANVELLRELPPTAFWPRPKVASAFVRITPQAAKRAAVRHLQTFFRFTRGVMLHRRKVLRVAMHSMLSGVSKAAVDQFLLGLSIGPQTRAESLPAPEFVRLANNLPREWCESETAQRA